MMTQEYPLVKDEDHKGDLRFYRHNIRVGYIYKKSDGDYGLQRCPSCERENYAIAVHSGQCAWCGFDANKNIDDLMKKEGKPE